MKTCTNCNIEKETTEFGKNSGSKDGLQSWCKVCQKSYVRKEKPNKKSKKKDVVKYRKMRSLINPSHPIPIKLSHEDGYGGKWNFDITKIEKDHIDYLKSNGLKNHMVNRKFKCWQVKDDNKVNLAAFCNLINMSTDAIITFDKPDKPVYVVNLFHPDILKVVNRVQKV